MFSTAKMTLDSKLKNLIQKQLVVFDFDDTLVDCNSDTWIHQLAPQKCIPEEIEYRHGQDYFKHVLSVLSWLHSQKITEQHYQKCLSSMPAVPGMLDPLVSTLAKQPDLYDIMILSDSNSFFINVYLKSKSLESSIPTVITNPARFTTDGQLVVDEYQVQDYCSLSSRNLCKGEALKNYIGKRMLEHNTVYTCINYVGDGENDFCPSTKLSSRDRVFPREGFPLARLCNRMKSTMDDLHTNNNYEANKLPDMKATVVPWTTGEDILKVIIGQDTVV